MRKIENILFIVMSLFSIISLISSDDSEMYIVINVSIIMFICILQLLKSLFKLNIFIVTLVQIILMLFTKYIGGGGIEYLLPIIIFELLGNKIGLIFSIFSEIGVSSLLFVDNILNLSIYIVIVNFFLYEVMERENDKIELREASREAREENIRLESKLLSFDQYMEQNNVLTSLKERNFMAQKMHDHLGHRITSSLMQLEVTKETLGKDNETSIKYLESAMENLREGMDEIREVLRNMKPREKVIGLEDIREKLLKFQYSSGIKTKLNLEGELSKISFNQWIVIEENIREALTNAAKYSKATELIISIFIYNKIGRIEIRDNGVGNCNIKSKGLGLKGIEERVESIGGRVEYYNDNGFILNMILKLGE